MTFLILMTPSTVVQPLAFGLNEDSGDDMNAVNQFVDWLKLESVILGFPQRRNVDLDTASTACWEPTVKEKTTIRWSQTRRNYHLLILQFFSRIGGLGSVRHRGTIWMHLFINDRKQYIHRWRNCVRRYRRHQKRIRSSHRALFQLLYSIVGQNEQQLQSMTFYYVNSTFLDAASMKEMQQPDAQNQGTYLMIGRFDSSI